MFDRLSLRVSVTLLAALLGLAVSEAPQGQERTLETITVRAHKREATLQNVPASISLFTAQDLSVAGLNNVGDLAAHAPGLDLQRTASLTTTTLRIRRVGNIGNIPTFEPSVGLFVDGAFRSRAFLGSDLLDVERVEILSGPQSTLYGKNVNGGVVAIYTKQPGTELGVDGELTFGALDHDAALVRAQLGVRGPITDTLGGSIAAVYAGHDATMMNAFADGPDGDDQDRVALRGQLLFSPAESFELKLLIGVVDEQDDQGESDVVLSPGAVSTAVVSLFRQLGVAAACPDNLPRNRQSCSVHTNTLDLEALDATLVGEYSFDSGWKLTSITGWDAYEALRSDDDATQLFAPALFFRDSEEGDTLQQELRITSPAGERASWLAGLFYYRNDYDRGLDGERPMFGANGDLAYHPVWTALLGGMPLALPGQLAIHDSHLDTRYLGVFGQLSLIVTQPFSITAGVRWHQEEKDASISNSVTVPGASFLSTVLAPAVTATGQPVNGTVERESSDLAWSVTPQYRFNDHAMAWFTWSRGAKFGGFNTGFGNAPLAARGFDDELATHHELGTRMNFADGNAGLSAAAFYTRYEDYQDAAFISGQFSVGNAERVDLTGFEIEGKVSVGERVSADFALMRAELEYVENSTGMCYPGRTPDGSLPGTCDLAGEQPINAPLWSAHLGFGFTLPARWGELFMRLDWSWTDDYNTSFSADPRLVQEAHSEVGLRLGTRIGESIELVLWGANLLAEEVVHIDAVLNLFNDSSFQSFLAQPRAYGMTLAARF